MQVIAPGWCEDVEDNVMNLCLSAIRRNKLKEISEYMGDLDKVNGNTVDYFADVVDDDSLQLANFDGGDKIADKCDEKTKDTSNKSVSRVEFDTMQGDLKFLMEELKIVKEENVRLKIAFDNM